MQIAMKLDAETAAKTLPFSRPGDVISYQKTLQKALRKD